MIQPSNLAQASAGAGWLGAAISPEIPQRQSFDVERRRKAAASEPESAPASVPSSRQNRPSAPRTPRR